MGYPRRLLTEGEEIIREFRPHWRLLVIPVGWSLLLGAAVAATWLFPPDMRWFDWGVSAIAFLAFLRLGLYPLISWWFTLYVLTNERLITRKGVLARQGLEIPLEQINDIKFSQNILERILHSGDLLIESAGEQGQSRFSDIPDPEEFHGLLYRVREDRTMALSGVGPTAKGDDSVSRLERLAKLHQDGMISREEYEEKKRQLLGEI